MLRLRARSGGLGYQKVGLHASLARVARRYACGLLLRRFLRRMEASTCLQHASANSREAQGRNEGGRLTGDVVAGIVLCPSSTSTRRWLPFSCRIRARTLLKQEAPQTPQDIPRDVPRPRTPPSALSSPNLGLQCDLFLFPEDLSIKVLQPEA